MWLPGPLYESLPYAYIIGGVLFISGTFYIGIDSTAAPLYLACGLISIVCGVALFVRRMAHRRDQAAGKTKTVSAAHSSPPTNHAMPEHQIQAMQSPHKLHVR